MTDFHRRLQRELRELGMYQFHNLSTAAQYFRVYETVQRALPAGSEVLDWGCGNGHFTYFLLSAGYKVQSLGMEQFYLYDEFKKRFPDTYEHKQADHPTLLPYEAGRFDGVISMGVLEHVRETGGTEEGSLAEIARVLKPSGKFICFHFPNRRSWIEKLGKLSPKKHHHQFMYDRQIIEKLVSDAGLQLDELTMYGALPRNELRRLPRAISDSGAFLGAYNAADSFLATVARPFVQNYGFVAVKPS
jgi:SAM-dependent methyltransferase